MEHIDIPARVAFVNIKDGSVFFDCNPAEGRLARQFVKKIRKDRSNDILYGDLKEETRMHRDAALTSKARWRIAPPSNVSSPEELTVGRLSAMWSEMEKSNYIVRAMVMNPLMYSTFRNWGKSLVDEAPVDIILNVGVFAYIWTADIIISQKVKQNRIILVSSVYRDVDDIPRKIKPKVIKFKLL